MISDYPNMMSSDECRAKAQGAFCLARLPIDPVIRAQWEATGNEWKKLAAMALLQEGLQGVLIDHESGRNLLNQPV